MEMIYSGVKGTWERVLLHLECRHAMKEWHGLWLWNVYPAATGLLHTASFVLLILSSERPFSVCGSDTLGAPCLQELQTWPCDLHDRCPVDVCSFHEGSTQRSVRPLHACRHSTARTLAGRLMCLGLLSHSSTMPAWGLERS
eukprot:5381301-Amphidinium_carterae.1